MSFKTVQGSIHFLVLAIHLLPIAFILGDLVTRFYASLLCKAFISSCIEASQLGYERENLMDLGSFGRFIKTRRAYFGLGFMIPALDRFIIGWSIGYESKDEKRCVV